ncbi:MAG: precorrin-6A reductase [Eubacterium sp.]|nr:precorrin-6A reductase [Eubacterium sp.]
MNILIFGGTTEGRVLSEKLAERDAADTIIVSVASDYGEEMLRGIEGVTVHVGRMDKSEMTAFYKEKQIDIVVDATHPFATEVTENTKASAAEYGIRYLRLKRAAEAVKENCNRFFSSCEAAATELCKIYDPTIDDAGNILLTTGSKELGVFASRLKKDKLFVRVIPTESSIEKCRTEGIDEEHIIALKGPFSEETNIEHIRKYNIKYLVTKESGAGSGYAEKLSAAEKEGVTVFVIRRPEDEGLSMDEVLITLGKMGQGICSLLSGDH